MKDFLENIFTETGVFPDLILAGHVHNYQRFTRNFNNKIQLPVIVAGAGGYHNLHYVDSKKEPIYVPNTNFFTDVTMEEFCDDRHGFLCITIEKNGNERYMTGEYFTVPRPHESWRASAQLYDYFKLDLVKNKLSNSK